MLEMSYLEPVGTNIYGYSQLRVFKIWEHFCYVLKHFILFLNFGQIKFVAFKFVGTQNMWVFKSVDDQIL